MHTQWFDKWLSWFGAAWDGEKVKALPAPTLEERIQAQIDRLRLDSEATAAEANNVLSLYSRLAKDVEVVKHRNAKIDAHYVRTMATAFDEKHIAFVRRSDAQQGAFQNHMTELLKTVEIDNAQNLACLNAEIKGLRQEIEATAEHLRKALARLRAVGEGN